MARKFSELRAKMPAQSQRRAKLRTHEMLRAMRLADLRRARELTQQQLAGELNVNQAWISKVERQTDMYLSTLRAYVEATGGELEIIARFNDGTIRINQLDELVVEAEQAPTRVLDAGASTTARIDHNVRLSVFELQPSRTTRQYEIWTGAVSNTARARTPAANTTSPLAEAA